MNSHTMNYFFCVVISTLCCLTLATGDGLNLDLNLEQYFKEFQQYFNKFYDASDLKDRRVQFEENFKQIIQHNFEADLGLHKYRLGVQAFSDQDLEQVRLQLCGLNATEVEQTTAETKNFEDTPIHQRRAASVDWRNNYLPAVKNQGSCGSCWAFAAVGALEAQYAKKNGQVVSLSEQQVLDCSGFNGCNGGWPLTAYNYIKRTGGIDRTDCYPYTARYHNGQCSYRPDCSATTLTGYFNVGPSGQEAALATALSQIGPVAVAIHVSQSFMQYKSGVFHDFHCTPQVNHGVLVVGYGSENGQDYWIVRNSWGSQWGEGGYIRMARNFNNMCHIASHGSYPTI